jgi:O-antigen ligase
VLERFDLDKTYQYLLIALAFLIPLTVFGSNLIIVIIVLLWLCSGNYKSKYNEIIGSKLLIASIVFYILHIIGIFWTDDLQWGFHVLHKMWYFLLFLPILFTIVQRKYIKYYVHCGTSSCLLMKAGYFINYKAYKSKDNKAHNL